MKPLGSYVTSDPWQKGTPGFTQNFQKGTPGFPSQFTRGSNNPIQTTDQRKNHGIICLRDPINENEKGYLDHQYQILIRMMDPKANAMTEFDHLRHKAKALAEENNRTILEFQKHSKRERELIQVGGFGPDPAAHLYTVPEWNYTMAKRQLEMGEVFSAQDVWQYNAVWGSGISPSTTMALYEQTKGPGIGTLEVTTVEGPTELHNTFGQVYEGDILWLRLVLVDANSDFSFRLNSSSKQFLKVNKTKCFTDKIWQIEYYAGDGEKERYVGTRNVYSRPDRQESKEEYVMGFNWRLGTAKDVYMKNHFSNSLNLQMNNEKGLRQFTYDILACVQVPTIRVLLDLNYNTFY